ncbi:hypothetical protein IFM47457_04931, partial [Aspergillus lentulus]
PLRVAQVTKIGDGPRLHGGREIGEESAESQAPPGLPTFPAVHLEFVEKARILYNVATRNGLPDHLFQHPDDAKKIASQLQRAGQSDLTHQIQIGTYATGSGVNVPALRLLREELWLLREAARHGPAAEPRPLYSGRMGKRKQMTLSATTGELFPAVGEEFNNLQAIFEEKHNLYARRLCRAYIWGIDVLNKIEDEEEFSWEALASKTEAEKSEKKPKLW